MVYIWALHIDDLAWCKAVASQQGIFSLFKQDTGGEFNKESIYRGVNRAMGTQERCRSIWATEGTHHHSWTQRSRARGL